MEDSSVIDRIVNYEGSQEYTTSDYTNSFSLILIKEKEFVKSLVSTIVVAEIGH